jgi:hypothetical protein
MVSGLENLAVASPANQRTGRWWLGDAAAVFFLLAVTAVIGWDRVQNDNWLGRTDLLNVWIPNYTLLGRELRDLNIPSWSPFQASGLPFAGDPQSGWMYLPVMAAYTLLPPVAATKAFVVFNIALGAVTTYIFARVLGLRPVASLVAASSFAFGANVYQNTYCCTFTSQLSSWLPMGFLGIELAARRETCRGRAIGVVIAAFAISQMMAGWMGQGIYNAGLLLTAYFVYRTLISPAHRSQA